MHKRYSYFLDRNKLIYSLQFGFRQNYSTSIIHLTETIKQALDQGLLSCGVFVHLQKAFNTVDHEILLGKLEHYRRGNNNFSGVRHFCTNFLYFIFKNIYGNNNLARCRKLISTCPLAYV